MRGRMKGKRRFKSSKKWGGVGKRRQREEIELNVF